MARRFFSIMGYSVALTSMLMSLAALLSIYFGYVPYFFEASWEVLAIEISLLVFGLVWILNEARSAIMQDSRGMLPLQTLQIIHRKAQKMEA
ncbi:MAG: hypothetical protein HYS53_00810 [Candidatus Aenigmarchaeota archaeon]|nr:hypothetical protein [Candidatus Aenigmarchaeota archaeon]